MMDPKENHPKESDLKEMDPKEIVARGYDRVAENYLSWAVMTRTEERAHYVSTLTKRLPRGSQLLDLGCGTGLPTTKHLARHFEVTGIDISTRHIEMAKENVPDATFVRADMTRLDYPPESFDVVVAFYSIIHVPREEQPKLLGDIASWLRPGGLFAATMGTTSTEGTVEEDWLGAPMYWSHFDSAANKTMVTEAGLTILSARFETSEEFGAPVTFLWIVAQKPMPPETPDC